MRRGGAKREKNKKINKMNKKELYNFIDLLEKNNQKNSHVYAMAQKQLSQE